MAISKLQLALLAAAMAAAAISTASGAYTGCATPRKVTIQNLSGRDLPLSETPLANSGALFGASYVLRHGTHAEFTTCLWTGRVAAPGAAWWSSTSAPTAARGTRWITARPGRR